MDIVNSVFSWEFMNEPLKRWFLFIGALFCILWAWGGIIGFMK